MVQHMLEVALAQDGLLEELVVAVEEAMEEALFMNSLVMQEQHLLEVVLEEEVEDLEELHIMDYLEDLVE